MKKRLMAILLSLAMTVGLLACMTVSAAAEDTAVRYRDASGKMQTLNNYTTVTEDTKIWSDGWYVVSGTVEFTETVTVRGNVSLILLDGSELTVDCSGLQSGNVPGICVPSGTSLTVYTGVPGTTDSLSGTGKLTARGGAGSAGIGVGSRTGSCGTVVINDGNIYTYGGAGAAGIGAGAGSNITEITLNRGLIEATGGDASGDGAAGGAGIGCGVGSQSGTITIKNATVKATGGTGTDGAADGYGILAGSVTVKCGGVTITGGGSDGNAVNCTDFVVTTLCHEITADGYIVENDSGDLSGELQGKHQILVNSEHSHDGIVFDTANDAYHFDGGVLYVNYSNAGHWDNHIYLTEDCVLKRNILVDQYSVVWLCLNGHKVDLNGYRIVVEAGGVLNIYDCNSSGKTRYFTDPDGDGCYDVCSDTASENCLTVTGGVFYNSSGANADSSIVKDITTEGAINSDTKGNRIALEGTINMYGGNIVGCSSTSEKGTAPVKVYEGGTLNLISGRIAGCCADFGGAVINFGTVTLSDGAELDHNTARYNGGAVYNNENGSFTMTGGSIHDNSCGECGGGIAVYNAAETKLLRGTITGNTASGSNAYGGGAARHTGSTDSTFTVGGAMTITGNTVSVNGTVSDNNLYLQEGQTLLLDADEWQAEGSSVGLSLAAAPTSGSPVAVTGGTLADYSEWFTSDSSSYVVYNDAADARAQTVKLRLRSTAIEKAEITGTTAVVTITEPTACSLVTAVYSGGQMISCAVTAVTEEKALTASCKVTLTDYTAGDTVKCFLLDAKGCPIADTCTVSQ